MSKFRKDYNLKIISLAIAVTFFVTSAAYGIDLPKKTHLRVPLNFSGQGRQQAVRRIYRTESIEQARRAYERYRSSWPPEHQVLLADEPINIINLFARLLERGKLREQDLFSAFVLIFSEERKKYLGSEALDQTRADLVRGVVATLSSFFDSRNIPFGDEPALVRSHKVEDFEEGTHLGLINVTIVPDDLFSNGVLSYEDLRTLIHETIHSRAKELPIKWLNEGITNYLTIMCLMTSYGEYTPSAEKTAEDIKRVSLRELLLECSESGEVSRFLFQRMVDDDEPANYFAYTSLVEYIITEILPRRNTNLSEFLEAYIKGDISFLLDVFGEDVIETMEILDDDLPQLTDGDKFWTELPAFIRQARQIILSLAEAIDRGEFISGTAAYEVKDAIASGNAARYGI